MSDENEVTAEQLRMSRDPKYNTLYVRLTGEVFRRIYKIAKDHDTTMSAIARICIESKLMEVENLYKEIKALKDEML